MSSWSRAEVGLKCGSSTVEVGRRTPEVGLKMCIRRAVVWLQYGGRRAQVRRADVRLKPGLCTAEVRWQYGWSAAEVEVKYG